VNPTAAPLPHLPPANCPFCRSTIIKTTSEKADTTSYWRCEKCGEVWNAGRLPTGSRQPYGRR
jgi:transposase-like protein